MRTNIIQRGALRRQPLVVRMAPSKLAVKRVTIEEAACSQIDGNDIAPTQTATRQHGINIVKPCAISRPAAVNNDNASSRLAESLAPLGGE